MPLSVPRHYFYVRECHGVEGQGCILADDSLPASISWPGLMNCRALGKTIQIRIRTPSWCFVALIPSVRPSPWYGHFYVRTCVLRPARAHMSHFSRPESLYGLRSHRWQGVNCLPCIIVQSEHGKPLCSAAPSFWSESFATKNWKKVVSTVVPLTLAHISTHSTFTYGDI